MIKTFTIIQKIWLAFFCLIIGILFLLIISFVHSFSNEFQYLNIKNNYIPMKHYCRDAETSFMDQVLYYELANDTKKTSYLDNAKGKAIEVEKSLLNIQKLNIDEKINTFIQHMLKHYETFTINKHKQFAHSISKFNYSSPNNDKKKINSISENLNKDKQIIYNNFKTLYDYLDKQIIDDIHIALDQLNYFKILLILPSALFVFLGFLLIKKTLQKSLLFGLFNIQNFLKRSVDGKQSLLSKIPAEKPDELGQTIQYINAYIEKVSQRLKTTFEDEENLHSSLRTFEKQSQQMVAEIEEINNTANEVMNKAAQLTHFVNEMTKASENVSMNIIGISSTTEQVASNMTETKDSIEKMTASVSYIARSTEEGMNISENIMEMAANANSTINSLGEAAREIGKVTGVIKRIAVQTNLLALNASIEASTAGEAGKGFAVVANKIKQFASQSAKSAEDIASRIEGVEFKTENAIDVINNISDTIDMVSLTIGFIADAVDQQNNSAHKINQYVQNSNDGANQIAQSISEASEIVENMSKFTLQSTRGVQEVTSLIQDLNDQIHTNKRFTRNLDIRVQEMTQFVEKIYQDMHYTASS